MNFGMAVATNTTTPRKKGASYAPASQGNAMPINKTTTIQARLSKEDKRFLKHYAESQGITLSELLRRSTTALIQIIKAQQQNKNQ
jgi:hypothetical protein